LTEIEAHAKIIVDFQKGSKEMKTQNLARLKKIISRFNKTKILVVGDLMLDEYIWGKVSRISPEAPVPVVCVDKESFMPGGASNVAGNIAALSGKAVLLGAIGRDIQGSMLKDALKNRSIDTSGIVVDNTRPTIIKTRVIAHHQQVVRIDKERQEAVSSKISSKLVDFVGKRIDKVDSLLIEDYGKGLITPHLLEEIVHLAKKKNKIITVDPKEEHFSFYKGITAITPNQNEVSCAVGFQIKNEDTLKKAGAKLLKRLNCKMALVTLGERGMRLFQKGTKAVHIPTVAQDVFDVSGAGDTVVAAFTLALSSGAKPIEAAHIANCAAGIVVGKLGTAVVTRKELEQSIRKEMI